MFLALDIGGTKTAAALFSDDGVLREDTYGSIPTKTFDGEEAIYQNLRALAERVMAKGGDIHAIGVGSPGPLDRGRGLIIHAPLMGWKNFPIVERLCADFRLPVLLDRDANLGALAEVKRGVAQGLRNVVYITVSTGIGGGVVINGEVYHGKNDGAGETGHISLDPQGPPCPCGSRGCFELYASGTALERRSGMSGKQLDEAAAAGDNQALTLYREEGFYLGAGLANIFNLLDPEAVVLGGGVTKGRAFFHEKMMETLRERCIHPIEDSAVRYSEMNDRVVLYGAYFMVKGQS